MSWKASLGEINNLQCDSGRRVKSGRLDGVNSDFEKQVGQKQCKE